MNDALNIAKEVKPVARHVDPASKHIQDWQWRPLEDVQSDLGLHEIPSHVHEFGKFMDRTAERASREGLTPRDLIKAYTITRASIQRRATPAENLHKSGLILPPDVTGMVRPEGAFGHWLHTPAGQAYLDAASKGQTHEPAIQDAMERMKPFGKHNDLADALRWGAANLPSKAAAVSHLVAAGRENASTPQEWRNFVTNIRGIGPSKAGFVASLMGRGDQPTLDARQIILHTGKPSKEASAHIARKGGKGGEEAVDRLAARQTAMNLTTPKGMEPYYQHLAHHAVWDKAGNEETTHQDVIDAMQHAARGGTIMDHPVAQVIHALHPEGYDKGGRIGHNKGPSLEDDPRFREFMSKILDPRNPEHFEAAKKIAENYGVNDLSYSGFKKHPILPSQVTTQISDIPGAIPKPENKMSWHDFYRIGKGGVLFTLGGDRSNLGRLTHINGIKLGWPVDLHAGTKYQREPNVGAGWANDKGAQKALLNNIRKANDMGMEAFGAFAPMQTTAIDSSKNMTDTFMSYLAAHSPDKEVIKQLNEMIRSGQHVYNSTPGKPDKKEKARQNKLETMQQFPGFEDPWAARNFAFNNMSGQDRSGMIKLLDRADYLKAGLPSVGVTRAAITDPDLLHTANNMVGGNIVRLSADKYDPRNLSFEHSTYKSPTKAIYEATVPFMPRHDVTPDFVQQQLMNPDYVQKSGPNAGEPLLVHPYSPLSTGRSSFRGNTEMRQAWQPINENMLESIEKGQERIKKYGFKKGGRVAYKKGGKVEGSIWHARDAFDEGGEIRAGDSVGGLRGDTGAFATHDVGEAQGAVNEATAAAQDARQGMQRMDEAFGPSRSGPETSAFNSGHGEPPPVAANIMPRSTTPGGILAGSQPPTPESTDYSIVNPFSAPKQMPVGITGIGAPDFGVSMSQTPQQMASTVGAEANAPAGDPNDPASYFGGQPSQVASATGTPAGSISAMQPQHYEPMANKLPDLTGVTMPAGNVQTAALQAPTVQPMAPHTLTPDTARNDLTGVTAPAGNVQMSALPTPNVQPNAPHTLTPDTANASQPSVSSAYTETAPSIANQVNAAIPTPMNGVPTPPIPLRDLQGPGIAEGIAGLFGLSTQQQFDKFYNGYIGQGHNETDAYNKAIGDIQTMRANAQPGPFDRSGKTQKIQKLMPDGTYQWVDAPYKRGGGVHSSQIVDHVLTKFGAQLPASNHPLFGNKAGRR